MGALYIKDDKTALLAERVAARLGTTKTEAVRRALEAIEAELPPLPERDTRPLRERMIDFWKRYPLPEKLGPVPDKAFYDDLSGDL